MKAAAKDIIKAALAKQAAAKTAPPAEEKYTLKEAFDIFVEAAAALDVEEKTASADAQRREVAVERAVGLFRAAKGK